jgi:hypothetical protein
VGVPPSTTLTGVRPSIQEQALQVQVLERQGLEPGLSAIADTRHAIRVGV